MSLLIDDDLAPELYPLAWLLGTWRGPGVLAYEGIEEAGIVVDLVVTHDGGPYLAYESTVRSGAKVEPGAPYDVAQLEAGEIWSRESGFWRPVPGAEAARVQGSPADAPAPTAVELLVSDPSGFAAVLSGSVQGPRLDLVSDWVAATASSPSNVTALRRMFGWVHGEIFWAHDLAAFGNELASYASGRLTRLER